MRGNSGFVRTACEVLLLSLGLMLLPSGCKYSPPPAARSEVSGPVSQASEVPEFGGETRQGHRRSRRGRADNAAAPGVFDFYLLNLSWSPEFCATHTSSQECGRHLGFVVHGLWPQSNNGDYPEDCSNAPGPANPQSYTGLLPTVSLVEHEWQTHGTCSGLSADAYFADIRKAFAAVKIPADVGGSGSTSVTPDQLLAGFASANPSYPQGSLALSCGNNRLTAVEICLDKNLQPESCQGVRSCRANSIQITPQ